MNTNSEIFMECRPADVKNEVWITVLNSYFAQIKLVQQTIAKKEEAVQ